MVVLINDLDVLLLLLLILQESNLLRRVTIFKMREVIASVVVRYYQFMASINFLAFSI